MWPIGSWSTDGNTDSKMKDTKSEMSSTNMGTEGYDYDHTSTITSPSDEEDTSPTFSSGDVDKSASFECPPYKIEYFEKKLFQHNPGEERRVTIIQTLRKIGVKVFVIEALSIRDNADVQQHLQHVISWVARENVIDETNRPLGFQRCLLYQDEQGRLFNLVVPSTNKGPLSKWQEYYETFSCRKAAIAFCILCRSVPGLFENEASSMRPLILATILGLVLNEEISLSGAAASLMVRAIPSLSAYSLITPIQIDILRKLVILSLAVSAASQGLLHRVTVAFGVLGAMIMLLANLGARSWHHLRLRPFKYHGRGSFVLAYCIAVTTGFALPFLASRNVAAGGKPAIQYVIGTSLLVAVALTLSDFREILEGLVVGSTPASQDLINLLLGSWWTISTLCSLILVRPLMLSDKPTNGERLLVDDPTSPVGYKVPSLPDYVVTPARPSGSRISIRSLQVIGVLLALLIGTWMILLPLLGWDDTLYQEIGFE